ncbi:MAG: hypothetical protein K2Z81_15105, partial [Cyanobacteria bacterium]|nr:hypothetical protein [Cyanobacteriota bacterium]
NESAMKALSDSKGNSAQSRRETPDSRDTSLKQSGMKPDADESHGSVHVYKPSNGETDKHGRTKVELIHEGGQLQFETSSYQNGREVTKSYSSSGDLEYTTTKTPDGKSLTIFPDIKTNADTMAVAYKNEGVAGLQKQIESVLKQGGNWDQIDKMLNELKQRGIHTYEGEGGVMKVDDSWGEDSSLVIRSDRTPAPAPEAPEAPDLSAAPPGFIPSWWVNLTTDGLLGRGKK